MTNFDKILIESFLTVVEASRSTFVFRMEKWKLLKKKLFFTYSTFEPVNFPILI